MKRARKQAAGKHEICHGTIDSWLVYKLTGEKEYRTDYSNASRTQLFNIFELKWDEQLCYLFEIDPDKHGRGDRLRCGYLVKPILMDFCQKRCRFTV